MDPIESALKESAPGIDISREVIQAIESMVDRVAVDSEPSRATRLRRLVQRHKVATGAVIAVVLGLIPTAAWAIPAFFPGQQWTNELELSVPVEARDGEKLSCELAVTYQPMRAIPSELERMDTFLQSLRWSDMAQQAFDQRRTDGGEIANGQGSFEALLSQDLSQRMSDAGLSWRVGKIVSTGECTERRNG